MFEVKVFMLGVEFKFPGQMIVEEMLKRKILINCTQHKYNQDASAFNYK